MRLFVAIYPPADAIDHLVSFVGDLHVGVAAASGVNTRLARPHMLHVTVAFIGEVDDDRCPGAEAALARAVDRSPVRGRAAPAVASGAAPRTGHAAPAAELRLAGGGRFGRGRFTVLWVGLDGDLTPVRDLHRAVRSELKRERLPYDERPWKPHLTLARPGDRVDRADLDADRAALHDYAGPSWPVTELVLVRSRMGPDPAHTPVATWPL